MSPPYRKTLTYDEILEQNAKESAVLIFIYEKNNKAYIVLIERSSYEGVHSKEISFPGGKKDLEDENLKYTAKRETFEEIGIAIKDINIIAELSYLYIPISNYIVYPFVAVYKGEPNFIKDDIEVEKIIEIPIEEFLIKKNIISKTIKIKKPKIQFKTPAYSLCGVDIWGATAMILSEFLEIVES